jgi:hypothetical protein
MNIKIFSIQPSSTNSENFHVAASIGTEQHQFTMTVETNTIAGEKIPVIKGDKHFCEIFRYSQNVAIALYKLVSKVNQGQSVELPLQLENVAPQEIERKNFEKATVS